MKKDTKAADAAAPAIVVFGLDESQRPHASWFAEADVVLAEKAAGLMGMQVLRVTTDEHRAAALELVQGRVFASGKAFTPFVAKGSFERLLAFGTAYKPEPTPAPSDPLPEPASIPAKWSDISLGSLVLAADGESPGWFEAIVTEAKGDLYGLRWVTWPDLPVFLRRGDHLSLLSAAAHEALRGQAAGEG